MGEDMKKDMKRWIVNVIALAVGFAAGWWLAIAAIGGRGDRAMDEYVVIDTIPYYDTITHLLPTARNEVSLGTRIEFIPVFIPRDGNDTVQNIPEICNNDVQNIPDSMAVEIPITQKEYVGKDYHAWVSGYEPSLDSIFVYGRREVVTIRNPPNKQKRWGVGVFVGYGVTPRGLQPCAGISVNYNLWNF